jgi:CubicO group peptidase (beta-lactamase class C family)
MIGEFCFRQLHATELLAGLVQQVKAGLPDPGHEPKSSARLRDADLSAALSTDPQQLLLAALQVRQEQASARQGPGPKPVGRAGQEARFRAGPRDPTVAAMTLYEEGRFQLDDPIGKYLPELKGLRVHTGKGDETVPAHREVTIRDLMRHTSGLTYGFMSNTPVDRLYRERKVLADSNDDLAAFVTKLGKLPLLYQPGTRFNYSVSADVLGRLVEVVSGKPLDEFFAERIFKPLDMKDTGFFVREDKLEHLAATYGPGDKSGLKVTDVPARSRYRTKPKLLSGGGGLVSTARDYLRFCQMMLNGGELEGTRILKDETVKEMTRNQLPKEAARYGVMGQTKVGFGLGFAVLIGEGPSVHTGECSSMVWSTPGRSNRKASPSRSTSSSGRFTPGL